MKIDENLKKLIEENALAFATTDENGNPHCIAVGYVKVVSENRLLITDNYMLETTKNVRKNPGVALVVWNRNWEEKCEGYELKGTAEYFTDGSWVEEIKKIPANKGEPCKGAILVTVNKIKSLA